MLKQSFHLQILKKPGEKKHFKYIDCHKVQTLNVTMVKAKALTRLDILQFWVALTKSLIKPINTVPDELVPETKSLLMMPVALADTSSNA